MPLSETQSKALYSLGVNVAGVVVVGIAGLAIGAFQEDGGEYIAGYGGAVVLYGLNLWIYFVRFTKAMRKA